MMDADHNLNITLFNIAENLREKDVIYLKFLCHDILPAGVIEKCTALNIIDTLSRYHIITSNNYKFLSKCLKKIHRIDLLKKLNSGSAKIEDFRPEELNPFRSLLFDVALDLRTDEVKKLRFFYREYIKENNVDALSIFTLLLDGDIVNERSFENLVQILSSINRKDLANKFKEYCRYPVEQSRPPIPESHGREGQEKRIPSEETSNPESQEKRIPSEETSNPERSSSKEYYRMESEPRGYCVVMNNIKFDFGPERIGATVDQTKLKNLFEQLKFDVQMFENLSSDDMKSRLKGYSDADHEQYDCFICFILSHGRRGEVYGSDSKCVLINELIELFNTDKCPSLENKPKLFFIQACQTENNESDCLFDAGGSFNSMQYGNPVLKADVSVFMSTIPGFYSFRCPENGCRFIRHIINEFERFGKEKDLLEMITNIINLVSEEGVEDKQLPTHKHQLRKSLRFF